MQVLLELVLALAALALAELTGFALARAPLAVPLLVLVPYALTWASRRAHLAGSFRTAARWAQLAGIWPLLAQLAALFGCGWTASVVRWTGTEASLLDWPGPALLLALAPFLATELVAIDALARGLPRDAARALRRFQVRNLLSALAPLALYLAAAGAIGASALLRVHVEEVGLYNALFAALMLTLFALSLPRLLRTTWETEPLADGRERRVLLALAARAGFRCREILVWRTGGLVANAAIVGLTRRSRVVLLSDSLLARLDLDELAAVFAHEMGHALRNHVRVFLCWALAVLLAADLVVARYAPQDELLAMAVLAVALGAWAVLFGALSRRYELDADLVSLDLLGDVEPLVRALEKVGGRLRDVAGWRHFSADRRVAFLRSAQADRSLVRRLRARLRVVAWVGALALAAVAGLELVRVSEDLGDDLLRADLRLGRYASAARAAEHPARAEGLRQLARRAGELVTEPGAAAPTPRELARAALSELAAGDARRAQLTLELLSVLEGAPRAAAEEALERLAAGDVAAVAAALEPLAEPQ